MRLLDRRERERKRKESRALLEGEKDDMRAGTTGESTRDSKIHEDGKEEDGYCAISRSPRLITTSVTYGP